MNRIQIILEVVSRITHWWSGVNNPEKVWQRKHDKWEKELKDLQDACKKIRKKYYLAASGSSTGDADKLWAEWLRATAAIRHHSTKEPKSPIR